MFIKCIPAGPVLANCCVISDEKSGVGAVIDIGDFNKEIENAITLSGMKELKYVLCTHGHFDHVSGIADLKKTYPDVQVLVGKEDSPLLSDCRINLANYFGCPYSLCYADCELKNGDEISLGEIIFSVYSVPGHSKGGVLFVCKEEKTIFSGDTLFKGSIGRTDLYGGDMTELTKSLEIFKTFPEDYKIYCGHGESTTVGYELKTNLYLR